MKNKNLKLAQEKFLKGDKETAKKICLNLIHQKLDTNVFNFLGIIELSENNYLESLKHFHKSLKLNQNNVKALNNIGNTLIKKNKYKSAIVFLKKAIAIDNKFVQAYLNISLAYLETRDTINGIAYLKKLLIVDNNNFSALNNLGSIFHEKKEYDKSLVYFLRALELNSNDEILLNNLGLLYEKKNKFKKAKLHFEKSLNIKPDFFDCQFNLSLLNLKIGNCKEGMLLYDSRFYRKERKNKLNFDHDVLKLTLNEINKTKKIYIISEQGYGDIFQFCRVGIVLKKLGYRVALIIEDSLYEFFSQQSIFDEYIKKSDIDNNIITKDIIIPLLSVPRIFELNLKNLNIGNSYIKPNNEKTEYWSKKIDKNKFNIGISWSTTKDNNYNRNIPINLFRKINKFKTTQLISLHTDKHLKDLNENINDLKDIIFFQNIDIKDKFVDTAAIIENLDLVICTDSVVTHLSAAMGKKTWVLLSNYHDWRWSIKTEKSYWYNSVTLFRNKKEKDWEKVMQKVLKELKKLLIN